jgi:hypothetical protein
MNLNFFKFLPPGGKLKKIPEIKKLVLASGSIENVPLFQEYFHEIS